MGMSEILKDIVTGGEVPQKDLNDKHKSHGPFSRQLKRLREMGLVSRRLTKGYDAIGKPCKLWVYLPTPEAIELYKKEVVK